jgi:hypothetical protein
MTNIEQAQPPHPGLVSKIENEAKKAFALSIYFSVWFCAISFLAATITNKYPIPLAIFGFAIIKGALSAKFLLISEAAFPIKINKSKGLIRSLLLQSFIYVGIVLCLNYLEAGVNGLIHGRDFWDSLNDFGKADPLRVAAMCIVYWLIVCPYLALSGLKIALGTNATLAILFGHQSEPHEPSSKG